MSKLFPKAALPPATYEFPFTLHRQVFSFFCHSKDVYGYLIVVSICISLLSNEHFSCIFLSSIYQLWWSLLTSLILSFSCILIWVLWALYIFWMQVLCYMCDLQVFSHSLQLSKAKIINFYKPNFSLLNHALGVIFLKFSA